LRRLCFFAFILSFSASSSKKLLLKSLQEAEDALFDLSDSVELHVLEEKKKQLQESVRTGSPKFQEQMDKEEEERKKAAEEAAEYAKLHPVSEKTHKERIDPRTNKEKIEASKKKKNQGNVLFKDGDFENAAMRYTQAFALLDSMFDVSLDQKKGI